MGSCLKLPSKNKNFSWRVPHSIYCISYLLVTLIGVSCRLGMASGAQPTYNNNQSGPINKQNQQASSSSSQGKDRSEDAEGGSAGGTPPSRYSGNNSHRGYSSYNIPLPKSLSMYSGHYPVSDRDSYYDDYYERPPGRQFSARSVSANFPMMAQMAATAANQVGFADNDYAATGNGGGGHGHSGGHGGGHGSGWGGGWGWGSAPKVDNASLGLLGLLGLLSLLSNVLMLITTTAGPAAPPALPQRQVKAKREIRHRREIDVDPFAELQLNSETKVENICQKILPSLNVIGHIQNGKIHVNCSHQEVCTTNQILVNELGIQGRTVGSMLSNAIVKMMLEALPDQTTGTSNSLSLDKYLLQASLDGRNGKNCEIAYPTCEHLGNGKRHGLPQLVAPEQVTSIVFGKNPRLVPSVD